MVQWLLEPESHKERSIASPMPSSLGTLNKRIESYAEHFTRSPAKDNHLVQDWLDRYVCPQTSTEPKIVQHNKACSNVKYTAVCPICIHPVPRLMEHLTRKCMSDSKGYTQLERKEAVAEVHNRHIKSHIAVVKTSELLKAYEESSKVQYIHYIINMLENVGIVTVRDHVFCDTIPLSTVSATIARLPSTASSEPSLADVHNTSFDIDLDTTWMEHDPITSTPSKPVAPQPANPQIEVTTPTSRAIFNPPKVEPSTPAAIVMPSETPFTPVESKSTPATPSITPSAPLDYLSVQAAASTANCTDTSPIPSRHLHPIVILEKMSVKRKLEDVTDITTPAKKARSISASSDSTICVTGVRYTNKTNLIMSRLGFYGKFELYEARILRDYDTHLKNTIAMSGTLYRNQQVANVNRILYKLHPEFCNPDALAQTEAIKNYFDSLPSILTDSTKINYIKSLYIFLSYCSQTTNVRLQYPKLIESMSFIKDCLASIRAGCSKRTTRKMAEKRAAHFRGEEKTFPIIDILKSVNVMRKEYIDLLHTKSISHLKLKSLNMYFVAVITLKNAQRPSVFSNMQLHEFEKPIRTVTPTGVRMNVGVVEHKTASTQLATVSFTESEYDEIAKYIRKIRPHLTPVPQ
ncbi:hypothetical protein ACJMK2_004794 [Sinanodonta woodiana]|uniref:Uncharacterized protein n=1 Tax=Sinanodonta woodiana TaxID=1069815 RepID=A0ABD3VN34_SINWO